LAQSIMQHVKAILFDVFGTVVDWRGSLIRDLGAWGVARGLNVDWTGLVDAWRGAYIPSMQRVRRGELPWSNLDELQTQSLGEIGPGLGCRRRSATPIAITSCAAGTGSTPGRIQSRG
jgi:2-haloacid dehalogenase